MQCSDRYSIGLQEVSSPVTRGHSVAEDHEHITGMVTDYGQQFVCVGGMKYCRLGHPWG